MKDKQNTCNENIYSEDNGKLRYRGWKDTEAELQGGDQ